MKKTKEYSKKINFRKLTRSGISLIVLVITIIVIIILAAAIIISISSNNPVKEANKARYESDVASMQSIFTNTVAKIMAQNKAVVSVTAGQINATTRGVKETIGEVVYTVTDAQNAANSTGKIVFDKNDNTDTTFYTGKKLPIYTAGETIWYVDEEGRLSLDVAGVMYGQYEAPLTGGLYDANDNLVASWDELINTYGMDIEKKYDYITYEADSASPYHVLTKNPELASGVKLIIPNSVTGIGDYGFYNCSHLTAVTIPNTITKIGRLAFRNCSGLTDVTIPKGVEVIDSQAFYGCTGLTSVNISNSVTTMGDSTFYNCKGLTSITIPASVISIGENAFYGCSGLKEVTISEGVTAIGYNAFSNCQKLTNVTIPNTVTSIGSSAFLDCSSLTSVTISKGVKTIGSNAFYRCTGLTDIVIPEGVTSIGNDIFLGCFNLTSIEIPESLTSIGSNAFAKTGITTITIHENVTSIGGKPFYGCSKLESINVDINNKNYLSEDGVLYNKDKTIIITYPGRKTGDFTIPSTVNSIALYAFYECRGIKNITIPDSVTSIGERAFYYSSLQTIMISENVSSIGDSAFESCYNLTSVYFKQTVPPTFGVNCFVRHSGDMCTFYFKNSTVADALTVGKYISSYGTKSTDYNW